MAESSRLGVVLLVVGMLFPAMVSAKSVLERDRERIQQHLKEVEARLRAKDVSHLPTEQRRARERNLDQLHRYWKRGVFPHNDVTDERTPIFIDRDGRECAVGHLMVESGWRNEAEAIASRENLKRLPNMDSPEVAAWLEQSGLTAEEATMIQPGYSPCQDCGCQTDPVCGDDGVTYVNECVATECGKAEAVNPGCCSADDNPVTPEETDDAFPPYCREWRNDDNSGGVSPDTGTDAGTEVGTDAGNDSLSNVCPMTETTDPPPTPACSASGDDRSPLPAGWLAVLAAGCLMLRRRRS